MHLPPLPCRLPALVELSPDDRQQLANAAGIASLLRQQQQPAAAPPTPQQVRQLARELAPLLPQLLPGMAATGEQFVRKLGQRNLDRLLAVLEDGRQQGRRGDSYTAMDP